MDDIVTKIVGEFRQSPWTTEEASSLLLSNMVVELQFELAKLMRYSQMWGNAKMTQKRMQTLSDRLSAVVHHTILLYHLVGGNSVNLDSEVYLDIAQTFHPDYVAVPSLCANMAIGFMVDWAESIFELQVDEPGIEQDAVEPRVTDGADDFAVGCMGEEDGLEDPVGSLRDPSFFGVGEPRDSDLFPNTILAAAATIANAFELDFGVILENATIINLKDPSLAAKSSD